jgi:hypothetical protein
LLCFCGVYRRGRWRGRRHWRRLLTAKMGVSTISKTQQLKKIYSCLLFVVVVVNYLGRWLGRWRYRCRLWRRRSKHNRNKFLKSLTTNQENVVKQDRILSQYEFESVIELKFERTVSVQASVHYEKSICRHTERVKTIFH